MARRLKSPAAPAITSLDELTTRVGRFAIVSAEIERLAAEADEKIAAIKADLAQQQQPLAAEQKAILLAAKPWWTANGEQLTDGKKKSALLAGCQIGIRLSPPSLAYPKPEDHAINLIEGHGWNALLRVKKELDKPAILKALSFEEPDLTGLAGQALEDELDSVDVRDTLKALGFGSAQKEEFFIARVADAVETTQSVDAPAEGVAA